MGLCIARCDAIWCALILAGAWMWDARVQAQPGDASRHRVDRLQSAHLGGPRTFRVYLPPSYHLGSNRYPVLYLHDGQNVFSFVGTNVAFGWGSWELDLTVDRLARERRIREIILVGVDNSPRRLAEYSGARHTSPSGTNEPPTDFERYARFLIHELKPKIDRVYRTQTNAGSTAVLGSSMGGICSVALAWHYPEVFGAAASLSGAFLINQTNFVRHVLGTYRGPPKPIRLYLDSGAMDFMGGDDGRSLTRAAIGELRRIGWTTNLAVFFDEHPMTLDQLRASGLREDKWPEAQRSQHNEFYWRQRVWRPLEFLFGSGTPATTRNGQGEDERSPGS
jgi:predicted alpha/beta superfamily hydrolase